MTDDELLALHRDLVATPSVSGHEEEVAAFAAAVLRAHGADVRRVGRSVLAMAGEGRGPVLALNSHLDTVPPTSAWTRDPFAPVGNDGRVYGLGANDAKASVAAMVAAFLRVGRRGSGPRRVLMLAEAEETDGSGTKALLGAVRDAGIILDAAVIGEPTGLDLCVAQAGRMVLALIERGEACHAAHRRALGLDNPVEVLARDLLVLLATDLGPEDPFLGPTLVEPTIVTGGVATNVVPPEVSCTLDVRFVPGLTPEAIRARLQKRISGTLECLEVLPPCAVDPGHPLVRAARRARPDARCYGSAGLSDWTAFGGVAGLKVGPGRSERSHTADEFVLEAEVLQGARFYEALIRQYAGGA